MTAGSDGAIEAEGRADIVCGVSAGLCQTRMKSRKTSSRLAILGRNEEVTSWPVLDMLCT